MQAYPLGVDLADVGDSLCQGIARHLIAILVSEFCGLALGSLRKGSRVGDGAGHDATDRRRDLEDVGDRGGIDKLILNHGVSSDRKVGQ